MSIDFKKIPYLQARWYTPTKGRYIRLIVLHSMEAPEKGTTAESVAQYFHTLPPTKKVSAHYCVDSNSIVQCVQCRDVAYSAPGANHNGIHIEMAGYARQTRGDWLDTYSRSLIRNAAQLCAYVLGPKFSVPAVYVDRIKLVNTNAKGVTTHNDVSLAFKKSTHTDPGKGFPMDVFLEDFKTARIEK